MMSENMLASKHATTKWVFFSWDVSKQICNCNRY